MRDRTEEIDVYGNLGNVYYLLGDYSKAIKYQGQHLAIAKEVVDRAGEGYALLQGAEQKGVVAANVPRDSVGGSGYAPFLCLVPSLWQLCGLCMGKPFKEATEDHPRRHAWA